MANKPPTRRRQSASEPELTSEQVAAEMSEREPFVFEGPAEEARFEAAIAQSDAELAARPTNVNFRWEPAPLEVVRRAAALSGMGYQNWVKHTLYRVAIQEIKEAQGVDPRAGKGHARRAP